MTTTALKVAMIALFLLAFIACRPDIVSATAAHEHPTWEYKILDNPNSTTIEAKINELGQAGWELITVTPEIKDMPEAYFFKRKR